MAEQKQKYKVNRGIGVGKGKTSKTVEDGFIEDGEATKEAIDAWLKCGAIEISEAESE